MSLINDLKTFVLALALGVVMTVSINYVVVNYTDGPKPAQAAVSNNASQPVTSYDAPTSPQKTDTSTSNAGAYY